MGYVSQFTISHDEFIPDLTAEVLEEFSGGHYWEEYGADNEFHSYGKWYDRDADIVKLSKAYPDTTFTFERHGEEAPDAEKYTIKNGSVLQRWKFGWVEGDGSR